MTRTVDVRFIVQRNDADLLQLYPSEDNSSATLRMDDSAEIKMSFEGTFLYDSRVNWFSDRIRPELIIDGEVYPLGVYLPANVTINENDAVKSVTIEAYDQCWIVRDHKVEDRIYFRRATNYIDAIKTLLVQTGISVISAIPTSAGLAEPREDWDLGDSYLEIVNQLLSEINYKPLWFNAQGMAILQPESKKTAANIQHSLTKGNVKDLIIPGITRETDVYSSPNVFICTCSNPEKDGVMVATAENQNLNSPLSVGKRGRRIVQVTKLDNIASQEELQAYADRLRDQSMLTGETAQITTGLLPGYGVADVVAVIYDDYNAICIEHEWEMDLKTGGEMHHTLERVVANYE